MEIKEANTQLTFILNGYKSEDPDYLTNLIDGLEESSIQNLMSVYTNFHYLDQESKVEKSNQKSDLMAYNKTQFLRTFVAKYLRNEINMQNIKGTLGVVASKVSEYLAKNVENKSVHITELYSLFATIIAICEEFIYTDFINENAISRFMDLHEKAADVNDELLDFNKKVAYQMGTMVSIQEDITKKLRDTKIDHLSMTTLVFTAFTVLAVNASIITGIAAIKDLDIAAMKNLFLFGNIVVIVGTLVMFFVLSRIVKK